MLTAAFLDEPQMVWMVLVGILTAGAHFPPSRTESIWCRSAQSVSQTDGEREREAQHQDQKLPVKLNSSPSIHFYKKINIQSDRRVSPGLGKNEDTVVNYFD